MRCLIKATTVLVAVVASVASNVDAKALPSTGVVFENVRLFDGTAKKLSAPANVPVVGNLIQTIFTQPITAPAGTTLTRVAGGGRTLMPGLIDNHVHVLLSTTGQAELRDPKITPEMLQHRATAEAGRTLLRGFTAVRDVGGPMLAARPAIGRGELPGPRNPYPGRLGVVKEGALADRLLVDGDPIAHPDLIGDPAKNFVVIMKDGTTYKNTLQ